VVNMRRMTARVPLSALLSQALVAFTIEFDNEFEHRTPHRTTEHGGPPDAPWLVSMVMWSRWLRFVPDDGITVHELRQLARASPKSTRDSLTRLGRWWGYIRVQPGETGDTTKPASDWIVRPTAGGRKALDSWRPLTGEIEKRWSDRFGRAAVEELRGSLRVAVDHLAANAPQWMPILGYGLFTKDADNAESMASCSETGFDNSLPALLSKLLRTLAATFEQDSPVSLAIHANVMRLAADSDMRVSELPARAGVSKEAVAVAISFLQKRGLATVKRLPSGSRSNSLALTAKGRAAQEAGNRRMASIEGQWTTALGAGQIKALRGSLERLAGDGTAASPPLFRGLAAYPDGWRAAIPPRQTLPHYPMFLHRGGFPDGS
jgi:DNA-binding MarR family transcriptional regulator